MTAIATVSATLSATASDPISGNGAAAERFDYAAAAELFSNKRGSRGRLRLGYRRFAQAGDAIRFAIEEMPPALLPGAYLEVAEVRFDSKAIRRLYDSARYPLSRRAAA
jgi:hypothetical protein